MRRDLPMLIAAAGFICLVALMLALYFIYDVPATTPPVSDMRFDSALTRSV